MGRETSEVTPSFPLFLSSELKGDNLNLLEVPLFQGRILRMFSPAFIRKFQPLDFGQVLEIERLSFNESNPVLLMKIYETYPDGFLVAVANERVVGYILFVEIGESGRILSFAVHPEYRRRGIGGMLLEKTLEVMRERGLKSAILEVRKSNSAAQKLYRKFGFEVIGEIPRYYRDGEDALLMEKLLVGE